jgi:hypothetical protein
VVWVGGKCAGGVAGGGKTFGLREMLTITESSQHEESSRVPYICAISGLPIPLLWMLVHTGYIDISRVPPGTDHCSLAR